MNILRKASILLLIAVISGFFVITYSFAEAKTLPLNPEIKTLNTEKTIKHSLPVKNTEFSVKRSNISIIKNNPKNNSQKTNTSIKGILNNAVSRVLVSRQISTPVTSGALFGEPNSLGQISMWIGKVNMHKEIEGVWLTDPDGVSGAGIDKLTYCKKFWPNTTHIEQKNPQTISGWMGAYGLGPYTSTKPVWDCLDGLIPMDMMDASVTTTLSNNTEYKVLVVLVNFLDSENANNFTLSEAESWFNGYPLRDFFFEQSYGKMDIIADVHGWLTMPLNSAGTGCNPMDDDYSGNFGGLSNPDLINALDQNNISFAGYDHLVVLSDCPNQTWGGYSDDASLNGVELPVAVVRGVSNEPSLHFIAHEMGHDLFDVQSGHANGIDCDTSDYNAADCSTVGYGNLFDAMGGWQAYSHHFRAQLKDMLGWFDSSNILEVTTSGVYTINPLETNGGIKMVKIKPSYFGGMTHYVEFRNGYGFDSNLINDSSLTSNTQGLFIYKRVLGYEDKYNLIDATPTSQSWADDIKNTTLNQGMVFNDDIWGVQIQTLAVTPSEITFQVNMNGSDYQACDGPNLNPIHYEVNPPNLPSINPEPGEADRFYLSIGLSLDNPLPTCLHQKYSIETLNSAGLNVGSSSQILTIYLDGEYHWFIPVGVPESLDPGSHQIHFGFTNQDTGGVEHGYYSVNIPGGTYPPAQVLLSDF